MEEKKNNKGLIWLIVILIILVLGLVGYIVYDKVLKDDKTISNNDETITTISTTINKINEEKNNVENYDVNKDIDPLSKELLSKLTTSDNIFGLFYNKISIEDTNNINFIKFNIRQYILDNKIDYKKHINECGTVIEKNNAYVISKNIINKYIQEKYDTINKYDFNLGQEIHFGESTYFLTSDDNDYMIGCKAQSGSDGKIFSKFDKIETKDEKVYLYTNTIGCNMWNGIYCTKTVDTNTTEDKIFDSKDVFDDNNINNFDAASYYIFNNLLDKTNKYKHTFIKSDDGTYYWYSTELAN